MFSDNPFGPSKEEIEFMMERDLDSIVYEIYFTNKIAKQFNPLHHRFCSFLLSLIPSLPKRRYDYEVDHNDNLIWAGNERREKPRDPLSHYVRRVTVSMKQKARHMMLPKTKKVRRIAA